MPLTFDLARGATLVRENWKAALTVSLVSLPLSISIAIASGATPVQGVLTAIWAGLLAAMFSSSNYNVIGPAGALTAILASYALISGPGSLPLLAVVSGVMILVAWALKLDQYIRYIPSPVVHGFALYVAVSIALNQLNSILGLSGLPKHGEFFANVFETLRHANEAHIPGAVFFLVSLAILFGLVRFMPKVPGAVILAPLAVLAGFAGKMGYLSLEGIATLGDVYPNLALQFSVQFPHLTLSAGILSAAATVALVAILETEISAKMADVMTKTKHDRSRETLGLAIANIGSGLFGGLPATGVFVRTSMNVRSGATHRMASGLNAICVAIISFMLLKYFAYIPMGAIAAILVFAAFRMVEVVHFKRMLAHDRWGFGIAIGVALVSLYHDALVGILAGTLCALVVMLENMSKGQYEVSASKQSGAVHHSVGEGADLTHVGDAHVLVYSIKGPLTYVNAHIHQQRLSQVVKSANTVVLRMREVTMIDLDGMEVLEEVFEMFERSDTKVYITGITPLVAGRLGHSSFVKKLKIEKRIFDTTSDALQALGHMAATNK